MDNCCSPLMNSQEVITSMPDCNHPPSSDKYSSAGQPISPTSADQCSDEIFHDSTEPLSVMTWTGSDSADLDDSGEPHRPLDSDCCGSGCVPCVFDLYERELAAWRRRRSPDVSSLPAAATDSPLHRDRFTALPLLSITAQSDTASVYRFTLPTGTSLHLPPGAHLRLRAADGDGRYVTRAYTPISPPDAAGYFDVYIRLYAVGAMSSRVRLWQPGQTALWSGPFGEYRARPEDRRLVLLAAGTGVAPFVNLIRAVLEDDESETRMVLLLAARRLEDVFPREELAQWARNWNFTYQLFISMPADGGAAAPRYGEPVRWRRLQGDDVREVTRQPVGRTRYLVCGTRSFEKDVLNYLREASVDEEDVFRF